MVKKHEESNVLPCQGAKLILPSFLALYLQLTKLSSGEFTLEIELKIFL